MLLFMIYFLVLQHIVEYALFFETYYTIKTNATTWKYILR